MKVSPAFSKAVESEAKPLAALRRARTLLMLHKDQEGGLRGKPYQGVSPFTFALCVCADTLGGGRWPVLRFDPISLVLAQRNGVEPPKKSAFYPGGSTIRVSATCLGRSLAHLRPTWWQGLEWVDRALKVSLTQSAVMLGLRVRGRGGRDPTAPVAAPKSAFLWGSTPFLCARAKKWGGTGSRGWRLLTNKTAHTYNAPTPTKPLPKVGRR